MSQKVVTPEEGRFSYAYIHEPRVPNQRPGEAPKGPEYSIMYLFPKTATKTYNAIVAALKAELAESKQIPNTIKFESEFWKNPLKDGDKLADRKLAEKGEDVMAICRGHWVITAKRKEKDGAPEMRIRQNGALVPVMSKTGIKSGDYGHVSFNLAGYKHETGGIGVGVWLNSVLKTRTGEALGGGFNDPDEDFKDFAAEGEEDDFMK